MPVLKRILETGLYVEDVPRSRAFYENVFELKAMVADDRFCAFDVAGESVLLLFKRGGTLQSIQLPGGVVPPHDGSGEMHFAFAVAAGELPAWEARLAEHAVEIESRVTWPLGGTSIYFRDPDHHLLELATPGIWRNY
jgi:catechol 2,3-dioxygenase-like lactoylglutathione lyase family enzyme